MKETGKLNEGKARHDMASSSYCQMTATNRLSAVKVLHHNEQFVTRKQHQQLGEYIFFFWLQMEQCRRSLLFFGVLVALEVIKTLVPASH